MEQAPTAAFPPQLLNGALKGWDTGPGSSCWCCFSWELLPTLAGRHGTTFCTADPSCCLLSCHSPSPKSSSGPQSPRLGPPRGTASRAELPRQGSVVLIVSAPPTPEGSVSQ